MAMFTRGLSFTTFSVKVMKKQRKYYFYLWARKLLA